MGLRALSSASASVAKSATEGETEVVGDDVVGNSISFPAFPDPVSAEGPGCEQEPGVQVANAENKSRRKYGTSAKTANTQAHKKLSLAEQQVADRVLELGQTSRTEFFELSPHPGTVGGGGPNSANHTLNLGGSISGPSSGLGLAAHVNGSHVNANPDSCREQALPDDAEARRPVSMNEMNTNKGKGLVSAAKVHLGESDHPASSSALPNRTKSQSQSQSQSQITEKANSRASQQQKQKQKNRKPALPPAAMGSLSKGSTASKGSTLSGNNIADDANKVDRMLAKFLPKSRTSTKSSGSVPVPLSARGKNGNGKEGGRLRNSAADADLNLNLNTSISASVSNLNASASQLSDIVTATPLLGQVQLRTGSGAKKSSILNNNVPARRRSSDTSRAQHGNHRGSASVSWDEGLGLEGEDSHQDGHRHACSPDRDRDRDRDRDPMLQSARSQVQDARTKRVLEMGRNSVGKNRRHIGPVFCGKKRYFVVTIACCFPLENAT